MNPPPVSIAIVSRGRPAELARCLSAVRNLRGVAFEVIVVADGRSRAGLGDMPARMPLKLLPHEAPGISAARNLAIAHAAGEIIAFLDDDAVPEPGWAWHLASAMERLGADAAGGHVLGRNGFSLQSGAETVGPLADIRPLALDGPEPALPEPPAGRAISTIGTCCAFRLAPLRRLGGFDPAYRYFLDESDLNMRLAAARARVAVVPLARVQHCRAASAQRDGRGWPLSLHEIGRSTAIFLRRHAPPERRNEGLAELRARQRSRLEGRLGPRRRRLSAVRIARLMETLEAGIAEGMALSLPPLPALPAGAAAPFLAVPPRGGGPRVLWGHRLRAGALRRRAAALADEGHLVSLYLFSFGMRAHRRSWNEAGFWEQRGGLFGRSERRGPRWRFWRLAARAEAETRRLAPFWRVANCGDNMAGVNDPAGGGEIVSDFHPKPE